MNIALFHNDLPNPNQKPGGVSVVVHRLANALSQNSENNVTVFSLSKEPPDSQYNHTRLFSDSSWTQSKLARRFLLPLALNGHDFSAFDVLHLHGDDWFFLNRRVPSVRTFHGSALREARSSSTLKRRLHQYLIYALEQISARIATVTAAVGPEAGSLYQTSEIIHNGVETDLFQPGPKTEYPSVLFVGTWEGRKRGNFLFDLFTNQLLSTTKDARLFMVSDKCPSHENVTHFPRPSTDKLASLYRKSWVLAHPSVYEGFGVPYIESMASGTPVITTPNPGAKYVLSGGEYGVLAEDDNFLSELLDLLTNEDRRRTYIDKGIERSHQFSWSNVSNNHVSIYEKAEFIYSNHK